MNLTFEELDFKKTPMGDLMFTHFLLRLNTIHAPFSLCKELLHILAGRVKGRQLTGQMHLPLQRVA